MAGSGRVALATGTAGNWWAGAQGPLGSGDRICHCAQAPETGACLVLGASEAGREGCFRPWAEGKGRRLPLCPLGRESSLSRPSAGVQNL